MSKKILVTGGLGFIGRHVITELMSKGYEVRVLDSLVEQVHADGAARLPEDIDTVVADIRDEGRLSEALDGIDIVIHLAAEVGVGQSMYEIERYVGANDLGTAILLQALINRPVERLVVASSMSIYGEGLYVDAGGERFAQARRQAADIRAGRLEPLGPHGSTLTPVATDEEKTPDLASIYALTKYAQERQALIFGSAYELDCVTLRLFNVFGPGQALSNPYTGVLANFASRLINGQRPTIFEDGRQQRDFVHVRDVARAFRLAAEQPAAAGHAINIGSGRAYRIAQVAALLSDGMGRDDLSAEILGRSRAGDIRHCFADIGKARELLGFEPQLFLEDCVDELVSWVGGSTAVDNGPEMRRQLEALGLVA